MAKPKPASAKVRMDVSGIEQLNKNILALEKQMATKLGEAVLAGAEIIRDDARQRAPRDTGELAAGIVAAVTWDKKAPVAYAAAMMDKNKNDKFVKISKNGKRYYYPASIEYGHPRAAARPFMRPAMDANKRQVKAVIQKQIAEVVNNAKP